MRWCGPRWKRWRRSAELADHAGASARDGQQLTIAQPAGVAVADTRLWMSQTAQMVESRSTVRGPPRAGARPDPGKQLAADPIQLADRPKVKLRSQVPTVEAAVTR